MSRSLRVERLKRREFLFLAGAAAARAAEGPIGVGVLGAVHSHAADKLRILRESPDWRLLGVCEDDAGVAARLREDGVPMLSRQALRAHSEIKVIVVESAVRDHARDARDALGAGKHVHLEKPPAVNLRDLLELVELARKSELLFQVGYMWRYHPGICRAMEAARAGWLGDVYLVKAHIGNQLAVGRRSEWAEFRGGVMFELGCHLIDPMVRLLGPPVRVTPFLRRDGAFPDTLNDNTCAVLEWSRALGVVTASTLQVNAQRHRALEIHGTNGCAVVNPLEPARLTIELGKPAGPYAAGAQTIPLPAYRRYEDDFRELAAAVRGQARLRVTLEEEIQVHRALLAAGGMNA
jgi:predicted dehydrogenase